MKKLNLVCFFIFLAVAALAQSVSIVPFHLREDMQIFPHEGEDVILYFPSVYLPYKTKINVVFPKDYDTKNGRFCSVYTLGSGEMPKNAVKEFFPQEYADKCVFVNIRLNNIPSGDILEKFLSKELLPYIETNYKIEEASSFKTLMSGEKYSSAVLEVMPALSNYFGNFAGLFYHSTAVPEDLAGISPEVSVFEAGSVENIARLQALFEQSGLKFYKNFAFKILNTESSKLPDLKTVFDFDYIFNKNLCKPVKAKAVFSADRASSTSEEPVSFWLTVKSKKNCGELNYIPSNFKTAPPFLSWDYDDVSFKVIYGAQPGKVKISGFIGELLPFDATFKITK